MAQFSKVTLLNRLTSGIFTTMKKPKRYKYILTIEFDEGEDRLEYLKEEMQLLSEMGFIEEIDLIEMLDEETIQWLDDVNEIGIS